MGHMYTSGLGVLTHLYKALARILMPFLGDFV